MSDDNAAFAELQPQMGNDTPPEPPQNGGMWGQAQFMLRHPEVMHDYIADCVEGLASNHWDVASLIFGLMPVSSVPATLLTTGLSSWCSGEGAKEQFVKFLDGMVKENGEVRELIAERMPMHAHHADAEDFARLLAASPHCEQCNDGSELEASKNAVGTLAGIAAAAPIGAIGGPVGLIGGFAVQAGANIATNQVLDTLWDSQSRLAGLKAYAAVSSMIPKDENGAPLPVMDEKAVEAFLVMMHGSKATQAELARDLGRPANSDLTDTQFILQELMEHIGGRASEKMGGAPVKTHLDGLADETWEKIDMLLRADVRMPQTDVHDDETLGRHFQLRESGGTATLAKLGLCNLAEVECEQPLQAPVLAGSPMEDAASALRRNGVAMTQHLSSALPPGFPPSGLPLTPQERADSLQYQQAT